MQENMEKNVKICVESPKFDVSPYLEHTSAKSEVIPGQAISIRELLIRAERGQRLGVQLHDPDFVSDQYPDGTPGVDEFLEDIPPQGMDISEFDEFARGVYADKEAFEAKRKKATEEASKHAEEKSPESNEENK